MRYERACEYCGNDVRLRVNWRGDFICSRCAGAIVRFRRELNELPTSPKVETW